MIEGLAARWLFTAVFAVAGLGAVLPRRARAEWGWSADRLPAVLCATMCVALIAMIWRSEPAAATWLQVAVFGCAGLRLTLASPARSRWGRRPGLPAVLHALMAGAMIWMLTAMPAAAGMRPARGAMVSMSRAATPAAVVVVSILLAVSCVAASIPWLARAVGPGPVDRDLHRFLEVLAGYCSQLGRYMTRPEVCARPLDRYLRAAEARLCAR